MSDQHGPGFLTPDPADPDPQAGALPPAAPAPRAARGGSRRGRKRRSGCLPLLILLTVLAVGVWFLGSTGIDFLRGVVDGEEAEDYPGPGSGRVDFTVAAGDSISLMGANLEAAGVVASEEAFVEAATADSGASGIQEGVYRLREEMAAADAVELLVSADTRGASYNILPGRTLDELVELLVEDTGIPQRQFERALDDPEALGLPQAADGSAEGYLFPGRYVFYDDDSAADILGQMVARWTEEAQRLDLDAAADRLGYSVHDLMTVASMVQAEGSLLNQRDRSRIARVIYNRLEVPGNPSAGFLGIDATIDYIYGDRVARRTIPEIDAVADNPYNTYRQQGLPPGPISMPGTEAIEAAIEPADGPWIYYATVNLRTAETRFATTPEEFAELEAMLDEYCATQSDRC